SWHDALRRRVQSVELRVEEILDRRRNTGRATRDERADDFLDKERISAGPLEDERANIWVELPPGHAIHHRARLFAGQWLEFNGRRRPRAGLVTRGRNEKQRDGALFEGQPQRSEGSPE